MSPPNSSRTVATGCSYGAIAQNEHAAKAVQNAIANLSDPSAISSVLLFLSSGYAHEPEAAIRAAVVAAGTPMVMGACSMSLLTEQEWLLDVEGAVAMVFGQEISLQPQSLSQQSSQISPLCLCLSSPNAVQQAISAVNTTQFGAVVSDLYGHGPYSIWQGGRIAEREYIHASVVSQNNDLQAFIANAEGVRRLTEFHEIDQRQHNELTKIDGALAVDQLQTKLTDELFSTFLEQPFNLLAAISETDDPAAIEQGHYQLLHVVDIDRASNSIKLSDSVSNGNFVAWAVRDQQHAQSVMSKELKKAQTLFQGCAKFAFMFPNLSRGPEFYHGRDRDLELFREHFPELPMIGLYGHAEILPGLNSNAHLSYYSTAFAIIA